MTTTRTPQVNHEPADFAIGAHPAFRPTDRDKRNAAIIARHIAAAGRTPTTTLVLRAALAKAAMELDLRIPT